MAAAAAQLRVLQREGAPAGAALLAAGEDDSAPALRLLFAGADSGAAEHEEEVYARGRRCVRRRQLRPLQPAKGRTCCRAR